MFALVPSVPPNSILGDALECKTDPDPNKRDLTIGAYRDDNGNPYVLPVVRKAEEIISNQHLDREYLSQNGHALFLKQSKILLFGADIKPLKENRVYSIQGLSGT